MAEATLTEQSSSGIFDLLYDFDLADLPLNSSSRALQSGLRVISGRTYLLSLSVLNTNAAAQYVQLHDTSVTPGTGAIPVVVFTVAGAANLVVAWTMPGRRFHQGVYVSNSSTAATLTAGAADCFFDAQFISAGMI